MELYLILVIVLVVLAVAALVAGVSNDAVNFLNSALGSKVAKVQTIFIIAIAGVIVGSVFSSGIMEVARKGIFHPEFFTFHSIIIVFLGVMLTNVILLDIFNSLGLPTSTTVSIVFELLGAAFMAALLITIQNNDPINSVSQYINMESAKKIVVGIVMSVVIAFVSGTAVQYVTRFIFSFDYEKNLKKYGAIFSGLGITAIVYFLLIKGLKGTTIISKENMAWIVDNTNMILIVMAVLFSVVLQLLLQFAKINPLKIVVLLGTFSLAMAFAGNDLVNFIGVPIAGLQAFQDWKASGVSAHEYKMAFLASKDVVVPLYMLLISGVVMGLTIWFSAKAKKVTETEISLGSQNEGEELFKSNVISRSIVQSAFIIGGIFEVILPNSIAEKYNKSFEENKLRKAVEQNDGAAFDLVRASINLVMASIIIAWATSKKLPLSTTYVSFIVAMGTSLADRAWGRESAVYRVAGVLSVIGGWFLTAVIAFSIAALFVLVMFKVGNVGILILVGVTIMYMVLSHMRFSKEEKKVQSVKTLNLYDEKDSTTIIANKKLMLQGVNDIVTAYNGCLKALPKEDKKTLQKSDDLIESLMLYSNKFRTKSIKQIKKLKTDDKSAGELLLHSSDLLQDITQSTKYLTQECLYYVKDLHKTPDAKFIQIITELNKKMQVYFKALVQTIEQNKFEQIAEVTQQ
ncbi:MAG: inorganic phosphate transporter, partial [Chitinophagales bacterium]